MSHKQHNKKIKYSNNTRSTYTKTYTLEAILFGSSSMTKMFIPLFLLFNI